MLDGKAPLTGTALLLSHRHKILTLQEFQEYKAFLEWLKGWQASASQRVRKGRDLVEVHRAQGELDVLERILGLEEELKEYGKRKLQAEVENNERQREGGQYVG
jgi:hypothetical protein